MRIYTPPMTCGRSRQPRFWVLLPVLLLLSVALAVPLSSSISHPHLAESSGLTTAFSLGFGGPAISELQSVYNNRPDLQAAYPDAFTNFTNYTKLINWAGGTVMNRWPDSNYTLLEPYGYFYALMATYNARSDLRAAYPHAYRSLSEFEGLVGWAAFVVEGLSSDTDYSALAGFGYWYVLMSIYNTRPDLQSAFPDAYTNFTNYTSLVQWAGGVVSDQSTDGAYSALAAYGPYYALMAQYTARSDLQSAYPDAYGNYSGFSNLVDWAHAVVSGTSSDGAYSALVPFGYWYALMSTYNSRADLRGAFPEAYSDLASFTGLVGWAETVVNGLSTDGAYSALAPFGYWYALMGVYDSRADLQTAFPYAFSDFASFTGLVSWAGTVVNGLSTDGAYSTLAPFGYFYSLMEVYNARPDLQAAFPEAYTAFADYTGLIDWAGGVVAGITIDGANTSLLPYGYYFVLMSTYNYRSDLRAAYPDAYSSFGSYSSLVDWAGEVVTGWFFDGAYSVLAPFGYYYDMMGVYDGRLDLQTNFPLAYTDWTSEQSLAYWAGAVVNSTIIDSSESTLEPFGYWYALYGLVYEPRADLQAQYPLAWTDPSSNHQLLTWAKEVVNSEPGDPSFSTLVPFAGSYDSLG